MVGLFQNARKLGRAYIWTKGFGVTPCGIHFDIIIGHQTFSYS